MSGRHARPPGRAEARQSGRGAHAAPVARRHSALWSQVLIVVLVAVLAASGLAGLMLVVPMGGL